MAPWGPRNCQSHLCYMNAGLPWHSCQAALTDFNNPDQNHTQTKLSTSTQLIKWGLSVGISCTQNRHSHSWTFLITAGTSIKNWPIRKWGLKAFKIVFKYPPHLQVELSTWKICLLDFNSLGNLHTKITKTGFCE